jgi:hypothetical protein
VNQQKVQVGNLRNMAGCVQWMQNIRFIKKRKKEKEKKKKKKKRKRYCLEYQPPI